MASYALRQEVDELREYMKELSYQGMRTDMSVNRFDGETRDYDAMIVCADLMLINETKSRLQASHIDELLDKLADLPRFYPEYRDRCIVGVLASLYPDVGIVNRATGTGMLVMGMGDEAMQMLNPDALQAPGNLPPPRSD